MPILIQKRATKKSQPIKPEIRNATKRAHTDMHVDREDKIEKGKLNNVHFKGKKHTKNCKCDECAGSDAVKKYYGGSIGTPSYQSEVTDGKTPNLGTTDINKLDDKTVDPLDQYKFNTGDNKVKNEYDLAGLVTEGTRLAGSTYSKKGKEIYSTDPIYTYKGTKYVVAFKNDTPVQFNGTTYNPGTWKIPFTPTQNGWNKLTLPTSQNGGTIIHTWHRFGK